MSLSQNMFDAVFLHCRSVFTQSDAGRSESMLEEPIEDSQELPSWGGKRNKLFNPYAMNGLSHPYHLDESASIFRDIRSNISF